ncbi:TonB-dependent receptor [Thalassotalea maritima]|uniref:TonB-dependent receptor n=1 Tax=Thalassotalea maritima TaxID=3242416 RepID=UPI00352714F6
MKFKLSTIATALLVSQTAFAESNNDIERVVVEGKYLSVNESNSVKSPTPILDVPQSLTIMTADDITERGITSIGDIIDYTPGVNTSQGEGHRDSVVFRGVRSTADFFMDGNRDDVQYYRSLYNVEQVEILRGPNALLFGRGGTGGILNRVSKKAQFDEGFTNYKAQVNSFGGYNLELDTNVASSKDSAVRINAMYEQLENHRDYFGGERMGFNPTARFELNSDTTVDVSYEYINHERFIDRGIATDADGQPIEALKDVVFADPSFNQQQLEAHVFRANVEHQFSDYVKGNFNAFYGDYDKLYQNFYAAGFDADADIVTLDGYVDTTQRDNLILSANLVSEFETGDFGHTVIFGGEVIRTKSNQDRYNPVFSTSGKDKEDFVVGADGTLNFDNLTGVNAAGDNFTVAFTDLNDDTHVKLDVFSVYLQDEIAISEHLDLVLGARFDSFDIEVDNLKANETRTRIDEEVSPRAGLVFKPQENISIYASYSESFLPRSGEQYTDIDGNDDKLAPDTYTNQEIGMKWDFESGLSFTAAAFENTQSSPQVSNEDSSKLVIIDQEITGFELQLAGHVTKDWFVSANYSNLDGEIVDINGPTGRTPRELPEHTYSLWTTYQVTPVFGLGFGVTHQGESYIDTKNAATLPSYTRFDASMYYDLSDDLRVQLNLENLTDEIYFPNAHSTHQVTVGAPANAMLTIIGSL